MMTVVFGQEIRHPYIAITQSQMLNFQAELGRCYWVQGDNGAGKSTLLKIIAGITPIEQGVLEISSTLLYVGADSGIKNNVTGLQYRQFIDNFAKCKSTDAAKNLNFYMTHKPVSLLSSGQKLWLRLFTSLDDRRQIWLLDEPARFLDAEKESLLWERVNAHTQSNGCVIFTSHVAPSVHLDNLNTLQLS